MPSNPSSVNTQLPVFSRKEAVAEIKRLFPMPQFLRQFYGLSHNAGDRIHCVVQNHDDKNESCVLNDYSIHCFVCGTKDIFDLYRDLHNCDFNEALYALAARVGIQISGEGGARPAAPSGNITASGDTSAHNDGKIDEPPVDEAKYPPPPLPPEPPTIEIISDVYERLWTVSLKHGHIAETTLEKERNISRAASHGRVGYLERDVCPQEIMFRELDTAGFCWGQKTPTFMGAGCLVFAVTRGGHVVNYYFRDATGAPKQFAHRRPRVTDLPRLPVGLWGLDECIEAGYDEVFLTESPIKALALIDNGFPNTTALSGLNLSKAQTVLLKSSGIKSVILCFDADRNGAGQRGALNAGELLWLKGLRVHIVTLPLDMEAL